MGTTGPARTRPTRRGADPNSYQTIFDAFYRGAFDAGLQTRVLHPSQLSAAASDLPPILVAPAYYAADDITLDLLTAYAEQGGHLIIGPRTAYADEEARARTDAQPARLAEAAGVTYDEFSNLSAPLTVHGTDAFPLEADAQALHWADGLTPTDAQALASYEHPHFGRWPAITTRAHGAGRITYVGTVPDPALGRALFGWAAPDPATAWRPEAPSVTTTSATARDGRRVRFLHNWSWEPQTFTAPEAVRDVLTGDVHERGGDITLGAWDVRVLEVTGR